MIYTSLKKGGRTFCKKNFIGNIITYPPTPIMQTCQIVFMYLCKWRIRDVTISEKTKVKLRSVIGTGKSGLHLGFVERRWRSAILIPC